MKNLRLSEIKEICNRSNCGECGFFSDEIEDCIFRTKAEVPKNWDLEEEEKKLSEQDLVYLRRVDGVVDGVFTVMLILLIMLIFLGLPL